jgi:hypothetical protein
MFYVSKEHTVEPKNNKIKQREQNQAKKTKHVIMFYVSREHTVEPKNNKIKKPITSNCYMIHAMDKTIEPNTTKSSK